MEYVCVGYSYSLCIWTICIWKGDYSCCIWTQLSVPVVNILLINARKNAYLLSFVWEGLQMLLHPTPKSCWGSYIAATMWLMVYSNQPVHMVITVHNGDDGAYDDRGTNGDHGTCGDRGPYGDHGIHAGGENHRHPVVVQNVNWGTNTIVTGWFERCITGLLKAWWCAKGYGCVYPKYAWLPAPGFCLSLIWHNSDERDANIHSTNQPKLYFGSCLQYKMQCIPMLSVGYVSLTKLMLLVKIRASFIKHSTPDTNYVTWL